VADWYDPGVGGHQVGDLGRGRIYRIAPPNSPYKVPTYDLHSAAGALEALQNLTLYVRYQAWQTLNSLGNTVEEELVSLLKTHENPRIRARALWLLSKIPEQGEKHLNAALKDPDANIRMVALRAARQLKVDLIPYLTILVKDPEAQVRREAAIAIRHLTSPEAAALWTQLANQHDGTDRWYLEALGIGAEGQWDSFFTTWAEQQNTQALTSAAQKDIVWRARSPQAIPFLASLASNSSESLDQRLRYFRAFDFNANSPEKFKALLDMLDSPMGSEAPEQQIKLKKLVLTHLDPGTIRQSGLAMQSLQEVLKTIEGTMEYVEMVQRLQLKEENPNLLQLAISHSDQQVGRTAAATLLNQGGEQLVRQELYGSDET